jgi:hypothetical protein
MKWLIVGIAQATVFFREDFSKVNHEIAQRWISPKLVSLEEGEE